MPDLILHHGKIITVNQDFDVAEAVAVRGERILAVGRNDEILKLAGPKTRQVDLQGQTVMPGLIESHAHLLMAAVSEFDHAVPAMESIADVLDYLRARAAVVPEGEWIALEQVFITRLRDRRYPTRQELDAAVPRHPVVYSTGPDAMLNSEALKRCGIGRGFRITDGLPGVVELDPATGEPTGLLRSCGRLIRAKPWIKTPSPDQRRECLRKLLALYNAVGITSACDRETHNDDLLPYQQLKERGELTCRMFLTYFVDAKTPRHQAQPPWDEIEAGVRHAVAHPLHQYDNLLWLRGLKFYLDGGMLTGSAFMREPWGVSDIYAITDPQYRGIKFVEPEPLYKLVKLALENGLQPTAHTVGDGAVHALIDAYERVDADFPVRPKRPCISHCNFMSLEAVERMQRLGIVADMQPAWLYLDGATLRRHFGEERLAYFQPYKTLFEHGVIVGGGSDHTLKLDSMTANNPYNPFLGMWIALRRLPRWSDAPLHPEQCITREQAIRFYTMNCAYLTFEEKEKGSLEPGKLADLIVLDRDILTCPIDEIKDIAVERTYLGGRLVYERN